ncbi:MAG: isoleucine--tRNA ligase [Pseudomonadota bacterium]
MSADDLPNADSQETVDYKSTLFLPNTDFPMRAGLPKREPEWLAHWAALDVYGKLREKGEGRPKYELHDGPPYANGHLHIGHALNKILKDFVVRSQQMLGHDSRYIPGWDCHGLPIEWKIEEEYRSKGKNKDEVAINELRGECRAFAEKWIDVQRTEFKRLGVTGEWDDPYLTMSYDAEAVIAEEFMKFVMNGSLYQGSKPVMWSVVEKTALAEAEVEYHEHQSHTIWVPFEIAEGPVDVTDARVVIWTTTPWTIPQNRAICYNPDLSYGLYKINAAPEENWAKAGDLYLVADRLADDVFTQARCESWEKVRTVTADELSEVICRHPFETQVELTEPPQNRWDFDVPMLPGDHVTDDAGTGFVHTAPSHGADDYNIGVKHNLPMTHNVMEDGTFRQDLPFFGGAVIFDHKGKEKDANKRVIDKLVELGALIARGRLKHSYPHSWRSKAPLIFRNTPQWFVAIDEPLDDGMGEHGATIRERALNSIDKLVQWVPTTGRNRLYSMIENRPDWVLSRQRAWGVPLTCFKRGTGENVEILRNDEVNARISAAFREEGADAWFADGAKERFLSGIVDPGEWEKVDDILDVWFDSGSTHAFTLRDRPTSMRPASLYLEGTDQHRGWFHSSMLQGCATIGRAPYNAVLTHGFTLDEKGMKMSKSQMNAMSPNKVVEQYGADIMRLWVAQTDYTIDQRIGAEILKGTADSYRRLRNTFRYMLGALDGFSDAEAVDPADMPELERWVLHRLAELDGEVRAGYAAYDYQGVYQKLFAFCTSDLSAFWFDIRKDSLYCDAASSPVRRSCRTVMDAVFQRLTTWLAPILVFTMEEVWLNRYSGTDQSVHLQDFASTPETWRDEALAEKWQKIRRVRRVVTGALEVERREKRIGSSLEAAPTVYIADADTRSLIEASGFDDLCITSGMTITADAAPDGAFTLDDVEGVAVVPTLAQGKKCMRCWKISPEVGTLADPNLRERCYKVVHG